MPRLAEPCSAPRPMRRTAYLVVAAFGCAAGPTADQACNDLATAQCARLNSCSATSLQINYGSVPACEAQERELCKNRIAAPASGATPATAESCAQGYGHWACADYFNRVNTPAGCGTKIGKLASGKGCAFAAQCASSFCALPPGKACGVCAASPNLGDSCAELQACGQNQICTSDTQRCATYAVAGEACGIGAVCGDGLACVGSNTSTGATGTCVAAVSVAGAPCQTTAAPASCDRNLGLACNAVSKTCQTFVAAGAGQPCDNVDNQFAGCAAGGACSTSVPEATGTCVAAAANAAVCDVVSGPRCLALSMCVVTSGTSGTCQIADGSLCQ